MPRQISLFLLVYYLFGILCLPQGDFSALVDMPRMYQHCKTTEDKDMTPLDFITDHLLNIDAWFDKHNNGDEQKPHSPIQFHHSISQTIFINKPQEVLPSKTIFNKKENTFYTDKLYLFNFTSFLFRPPIS